VHNAEASAGLGHSVVRKDLLVMSAMNTSMNAIILMVYVVLFYGRGKWLAHYITEPADTDSWGSRFWPFIIKQAFNDCCFGIRIIFSNILWRFSWLVQDLYARNFVGRAGRRRMLLLLLLYWFTSGKVWPRSVNLYPIASYGAWGRAKLRYYNKVLL
jgi:hypothetical protein